MVSQKQEKRSPATSDVQPQEDPQYHEFYLAAVFIPTPTSRSRYIFESWQAPSPTKIHAVGRPHASYFAWLQLGYSFVHSNEQVP